MSSKEELNFGAIDDEFIHQLRRVVKDVVVATRQHRDPTSKHWKVGLPVFLCGGGSQLDVYIDAIQACSATLTETLHIAGLVLKNIPKPEGLETPDLLAENYHRLAVAYGLSQTADDIGRVIPPSQIESIPPPAIKDYRKNDIWLK